VLSDGGEQSDDNTVADDADVSPSSPLVSDDEDEAADDDKAADDVPPSASPSSSLAQVENLPEDDSYAAADQLESAGSINDEPMPDTDIKDAPNKEITTLEIDLTKEPVTPTKGFEAFEHELIQDLLSIQEDGLHDPVLLQFLIKEHLAQVGQGGAQEPFRPSQFQPRQFVKVENPGDGKCFYHSISPGLYGDLSHSDELRLGTRNWLTVHGDDHIKILAVVILKPSPVSDLRFAHQQAIWFRDIAERGAESYGCATLSAFRQVLRHFSVPSFD
jgi:hypothetical protein